MILDILPQINFSEDSGFKIKPLLLSLHCLNTHPCDFCCQSQLCKPYLTSSWFEPACLACLLYPQDSHLLLRIKIERSEACHPFREIQAIAEIGGWQGTVPPWCLMNKKLDSGLQMLFMVSVKTNGWG